MFNRLHAWLCLMVVGGLPGLAATAPGIHNFDQVDANVFRGAQPTGEGFRYLAGIGVKTVIDLREAGDRAGAEKLMVKKFGMAYLNIPMTGLTPPTEAELVKILPVMENTSAGPIFVHCLHGADRTGAVIAAYRIDHDGWDNARALKDAKAHGIGHFQIPRLNFIKNFRPLINQAKTTAQDEGSASFDFHDQSPLLLLPSRGFTLTVAAGQGIDHRFQIRLLKPATAS